MDAVTHLEPLSRDRARQLLSLLREATADDADALVLDDAGHVTGTALAADAQAEHLLGDLDVHA